jgi:hypothetical protein
MKIHQYNEMMRYLTRKKDNLSVEEKKKILDDHYKPKPMPITEYIQTMNRLYGNGDVEPHTESDDPRYLSPEDKKDILQSIPVSPLVKKKDKPKGPALTALDNIRKEPKKVSTKPRYVWNIAKGALEDTKTDEYGNPETATTRIQELDKKPKKKKQIKKVADKPKPKPTYLNGNVIDITPLIDDEWWKILDYPLIPEEDPSEKTRRRYERLKQLEEERIVAKGLGNLLKLKKYRYET